MPTLSIVITDANGKKVQHDLTSEQSRLIKEQLCMGKHAGEDVQFVAGNEAWAKNREGMGVSELSSFLRLFESLRETFT